jgi:hypothetical protein
VRISFLYNEVVEYKGGALTLKLRLQGSLGPWGSTCGEPAPACPAQPLSELPRPRCCWGVSPHLRQSWLQKGRCHHPHFRIDSEKGSLSAVTSRVACPGRESPDPDSSDPSRLPSRAPPPPGLRAAGSAQRPRTRVDGRSGAGPPYPAPQNPKTRTPKDRSRGAPAAAARRSRRHRHLALLREEMKHLASRLHGDREGARAVQVRDLGRILHLPLPGNILVATEPPGQVQGISFAQRDKLSTSFRGSRVQEAVRKQGQTLAFSSHVVLGSSSSQPQQEMMGMQTSVSF